MNFIEAVQALKDGRCEGILHTDWSQHKPQYLVHRADTLTWNNGSSVPAYTILISQFASQNWQLVNPRPLTETKEVIGWRRRDREGNLLEYTEKVEVVNGWERQSYFYEVVHGTYTVEVKQKVKRREELPRMSMAKEYLSMSPDTRFYAEWQEDAP